MLVLFWILLVIASVYMFFNRNLILGYFLELILISMYYLLDISLFHGWIGIPVYIIMLWWIVSVTSPARKLKPAVRGAVHPTEVIQVRQGKLTGCISADQKTEIYTGIPYAKPPVGSLRWKEPQDPDPWTGIKRMEKFGPMAMQKETPMVFSTFADLFMYKNPKRVFHDRFRPIMSEDCLYLNIWKPAGPQHNLPVVFYIHGGSLTTGQSWWDDYDGTEYAKKGIIFITFTYRLNIFGFFADEQLQKESDHHTTGMYGFLDQIKALQWVKENISAFGGDPDNITIAGESAGSSCVNALCVSPLARGLFSKAIGESSSINAKHPVHSFIPFQKALETGQKFKDSLSMQDISSLRNIPAKTLEKMDTGYETLCALTDDGYALTESPFDSYQKGIHNEAALLNGYNLHDGDFFAILSGRAKKSDYRDKIKSLYHAQTDEVLKDTSVKTDKEADQLYLKLYNPAVFTYGHYCWSRCASRLEPVYEYIFTKENKTISSQHTGELYYCYGSWKHNPSRYHKEDRKLSDEMMSYWINFIRTGNPNGKDLPEWKTFTQDEIMELGKHTGMIRDRYHDIYQILDRIQNESPTE